jgi:RimJ/RimL family protein N-acetyltransferase
MLIETPRLRLRPWRDSDRPAFAALHADREVMHDAGGPLDHAESDAKLDRYIAAFERYGFTRWGIESLDSEFLGYTGIMPSRPDHPLGDHVDIGWRLVRSAWEQGYASEAATAALQDAFARCGLPEVIACTTADNRRSQAVMARLGLRREPARDFRDHYGTRVWDLLVWVASPPLP